MNALLVGRFHAVTMGQHQWLQGLKGRGVERVTCVITSANHSGTRRNPLPVPQRRALLAEALAGQRFDLVAIDDIAETESWVEHVLSSVERAGLPRPAPRDTQVYTSNRDVAGLFEARGFTVVAEEVKGLTPHELVQRIADGREWQGEASQATRAAYADPKFLTDIFHQRLLNDDGELGHARDFQTYGAQMDASLKQKLDDLLPWVVPGSIVDKGCGTGKLLVELSRAFPRSALTGVDLSRELLRMSDENTYASEEVALVFGNIIEKNVPDGSASTVIFSSVTHEIYSYSGYSLPELERAMRNAAAELKRGGRVLMRDGVSPPPATWRLKLLDAATRETFERFAREFKHGAGVKFERVGEGEVRLSAHDANEFLCKKDYLKNWHIEVHEEYGALTLEGWRALLEKVGLKAVHLSGYVNGWIAENRYQGHVELVDDAGAPLPWPATNCVVVGEKP
ncbi:MAG: methyltransferase domain-containing protein [Archangiaceae bacterium]|nr:methyltransferase domain-containing protein [Archangiaceae bacterium]